MKRPTLILLGTVLLASAGTAILIAASYRPAARSAELENFHLVGPTGRSYSIESFPSGSVLAIYFGYTTCQRSCPTALNSIAEAIERLGNRGAAVQPVFIDMDPQRAALVDIPAYMESFGPGFLGLTGSTDDVELAAKSFKVKLERIQLSDDPTDYVLADFRDAAKRPPPKNAASHELAGDNRGYPENRALTALASKGLAAARVRCRSCGGQ